jgi:hypothetical protein
MLPRPALLAAMALLAFTACGASAQLARKPSFYDQQGGTATAPRGTPGVGELPALAGRADFDRLARVYDAGTPLELPHVLFVIDRRATPARMHFVNTPRYALHERFVRATGLLREAGRAALNRNYRAPDRRFVFGTLGWQAAANTFSYEFWEGDRLTPELLALTQRTLAATFYAPARFKANSTQQEAVAQAAGIEALTQAALIQDQPYLPMNRGRAVGRLRIVPSLETARDLAPTDIVVLREVPISLPPVAGVLTERPSTVLSHVNLLAKGLGIPNAYVRDAAQAVARWDGQWVQLEVAASGYTLRAATEAERTAAQQAVRGKAPQARLRVAPDLQRDALVPLAALRATDSRRCGAKAANLGAVQAARIAGTVVPDGFCIPFAAYAQFTRSHGLAERLARMQQLPRFAEDAQVRRDALAALRAEMTQWPLPPGMAQAWQARWTQQLGGAGVFVRSSSNSEDLAHFSGAGLYTTVPNVREAEALAAAVRTVWASVYNFEAWEARRAAGLDEETIVMGVLVQTAIDSTASGVMVTRDPFDAAHRHATYISAKRGIGIRVVEGKRIAEQVMYSSRSKAVQVLNRSGDDVALQLDPAGGVREVPVQAGRAVLTDELVQRLAGAGAAIRRAFGGHDQDIEWAVQGDRLVILQARPFVTGASRP